jgi:ABC-type multidrug transport system fused ATPase/permease subunit
MDMIAFGLLATAAVLTMACKSFIRPGLLALAMTHLLQLSGSMQWAVRQTAEAENHMTSVERMLAYCDLPQERLNASERSGPSAIPLKWPSSAQLEFDCVQVRPLHVSSILCCRMQLFFGFLVVSSSLRWPALIKFEVGGD